MLLNINQNVRSPFFYSTKLSMTKKNAIIDLHYIKEFGAFNQGITLGVFFVFFKHDET